MIYLSKGIVQKGSTEQLLFVLYGSQKFELTGNAAAAWLNGRFNFAEALGRNEPPVTYLQKLGLVETEPDDHDPSRYRIASRCIFCPTDAKCPAILDHRDKMILQWLKNVGIRLSVAELESQISQTTSQRKAQQDHRQAVLFLPYVSRTF